jgi:hypothetical protein
MFLYISVQAPTLPYDTLTLPQLMPYQPFSQIHLKKPIITIPQYAARNGGPYGENIALGYPTVRDTCYAWGEAERASYTPAEYEHPSYNSRMGHFTQIVWVGTQRVGCARKLCDGRWFVACEYSARGNIRAEEYYKKNVLPPVAKA